MNRIAKKGNKQAKEIVNNWRVNCKRSRSRENLDKTENVKKEIKLISCVKQERPNISHHRKANIKKSVRFGETKIRVFLIDDAPDAPEP